MVARSYIMKNLNDINKHYLLTSNLKLKLYFSKLAILELCGWIEESMDDIVIKFANRKLKIVNNIDLVRNKFIKYNHGFHYESNFRPMLIKTIGIINVEKIENRISNAVMHLFKSALGNLKTKRDNEAHSYIRGVTRTIQAPSITIREFNQIFNGLKEIEEKIKNI